MYGEIVCRDRKGTWRSGLAEILPFELLYVLAAILSARMIWCRYAPAEDGWAPGIAMALFVSVALAAGGTLLGEMWNWSVETHRIGNNHMSYRADRLFLPGTGWSYLLRRS